MDFESLVEKVAKLEKKVLYLEEKFALGVHPQAHRRKPAHRAKKKERL
jgi:hypothetical protein